MQEASQNATDDLRTAPRRRGLSGITHDGDIYCVDCALDMGIIDHATDADDATDYVALVDGDRLPFRRAPSTGAALPMHESDTQHCCGRMCDCVHSDGDDPVKIEMRVIGGYY